VLEENIAALPDVFIKCKTNIYDPMIKRDCADRNVAVENRTEEKRQLQKQMKYETSCATDNDWVHQGDKYFDCGFYFMWEKKHDEIGARFENLIPIPEPRFYDGMFV